VAVAVDRSVQAPQPKPIIIFKGEGKRLPGEHSQLDRDQELLHFSPTDAEVEVRQWSPDVTVLFQPKGVVDGSLMKDIYAGWGRDFGSELTLLIGDSARAHWTVEAKAGRPKHVIFGRIDEGITSLTQFLDLSWFAHFKHHYGEIFQSISGFVWQQKLICKGPKLNPSCKAKSFPPLTGVSLQHV
jgi:hypothetical protein